MKDNSNKAVHIILLGWTVIGLMLLFCILITDRLGNSFMQDIMKKLVILYLFSSCILSGVVTSLRKKH